MTMTKKKATEIATIDVALVVFRTGNTTDGTELAIDTANKVSVEPQIDTVDAIRNVKLGRVIAQKPAVVTIAGHQIIMTDNVFTPEVVVMLQGGTLTGTGESMTYTPPISGSSDKGEVFEADFYSAQYDSSGMIVKYEKITYPNCQGSPVTIATEDGVFRMQEYTINSAPRAGEPPYKISYVNALPVYTQAMMANMTEETGIARTSTELKK